MSIEHDGAVRPTTLVWSPLEYACHVRDVQGASFTVDSLGRYHLHDVEHHLHDVGA